MSVDAEAARLAELDAATATQEGQIFPLKFRQLPGDAISEAEFSDDDSDYELIEPGDLDMVELAGAPAPAAAAVTLKLAPAASDPYRRSTIVVPSGPCIFCKPEAKKSLGASDAGSSVIFASGNHV